MRAEYVFVVVGLLWCFAGPPAVQAAARTSTRTASLIEALNEAQGPPPSSSSQGVKQVQLASGGTSHLSTATPSLFSSEKEQQQEQQQQPSSSSSGDSAGGSTDERVIHDIQHSTEAHNQRTFIGPGGAKVVVLSNANSMEDIEVATSVDPKVEKEEMRKSRIEELNKRRGEQFVKMRQEEIQKKQQEAKLELLEKEETHNKRLKMLQLKSKDREENMKLREQQRQNEEQFQKAQAKRTQEEQGKALAQRQEGHDKRVQQRAQEQRVKATSIRLVNYRAYGKGYAPVSLHKEGVVCLVSGVASGSNSLVGIMPPACRPTEGRLVLNVIKNNVDTQLDILPDGRMFALTQPGFGWLSLSGIAFSTQPVHPIQLLNSWTVYGKHYRAPTQAKQEDLCVLGGVLQRGKTNVIGRVDEWCWPRDGQLVFSVNHRDRVTRLDVTTAGYIVKNGGSDKYGWVSLDGLVYTQHAGETLALVNGWTHYNKGYRFGSFRKVGRVVYLSGVIQSGSWNHVISVLPAGYRPAHRQVFSVNVHGQGARVDVLPDGRLAYISGRPDKIWWLSLDGIHFVAAS